jgi:Na+/melibiose symporter-like transporter
MDNSIINYVFYQKNEKMKKREAILIVIAVIVTALAYFSSKQTEKRVQEFIEQKESKEDKKLKLVPLKTILL